MTTQSTIDKLIEMRLTSMSDAFRTQMEDPRMKGIPFEDRFGMLVDIEYSNRKSNSLKRLIRNAGFDQPEAYIGDINYTSGRKLNRSLIERLATCEYITEHRNLFITGATGSGKTYLACAFGMEACKQRYKTKYVRLPDLLLELELARNDGTYPRNRNSMIYWNFSTGDAGSHLPSSALSMIPMAGMISWVVMTVLCRKQSWTASSMTHIRSTSFQPILRIIDLCGRYMD